MKLTAIAVTATAYLILSATPGMAAPGDSTIQSAIEKLVFTTLQESKASDPEGFASVCTLFAINSTRVINIFTSEPGMKKAEKALGASKANFKVGITLALKKACK